MAKNKIQFQKGLSLPRFLSQYGPEEQCREALFKMRWPQGFCCPKCGHTGYCEIDSRKVYQCHECRFQASLIQGTIFAATKLPLTTWLLGIYLVTQSKDGISSLHLARTVGISANAALRMKHKLQQVMKDRDDQQPLNGPLLLDDAYWGGKKRDGTRGRGFSGKMPWLRRLYSMFLCHAKNNPSPEAALMNNRPGRINTRFVGVYSAKPMYRRGNSLVCRKRDRGAQGQRTLKGRWLPKKDCLPDEREMSTGSVVFAVVFLLTGQRALSGTTGVENDGERQRLLGPNRYGRFPKKTIKKYFTYFFLFII